MDEEEHHEKKGLTGRTMQTIREQEALCLVLRDFDNPALAGDPDPLGELEAFHAECVFADHEIVDYRTSEAADHARGHQFTGLLIERGIIKAHEKFFVSLAHSDEDIDTTIEAIEEVAAAMAE